MRLFRLIATPIVLLALLGALLWGASWGWQNLTAPLPTPEPTPCVTRSVDMVTPADVTVRVLNGGFTTGLAGKAADHLEKQGFQILSTGNTEERVKGTVVRGSIENETALQLTAGFFTEPTVEHDARVDGTIDVLVGSEFGGLEDGPTELPADDGTLCVPPSPGTTPSPSPTASPSPTEGE